MLWRAAQQLNFHETGLLSLLYSVNTSRGPKWAEKESLAERWKSSITWQAIVHIFVRGAFLFTDAHNTGVVWVLLLFALAPSRPLRPLGPRGPFPIQAFTSLIPCAAVQDPLFPESLFLASWQWQWLLVVLPSYSEFCATPFRISCFPLGGKGERKKTCWPSIPSGGRLVPLFPPRAPSFLFSHSRFPLCVCVCCICPWLYPFCTSTEYTVLLCICTYCPIVWMYLDCLSTCAPSDPANSYLYCTPCT